MKRHPPDLEDQIFAREVNAKLGAHAMIDLFSIEPDDGAREYKLVMSCGGHRRTISSESPFAYGGVADIVARVERWVGTMDNPNAKWTDDPSQAA